MATRISIVGTLAGALVVGCLSAVAPAAADEPPPTFSADPLPTWQTDGAVWAVETIGSTVYVGGAFNNVRPPGAALGSELSVPRSNLAAFDAQTGDLLPCAPKVTLSSTAPRVLALEASPDGSRLFVGGTFSGINGTSLANLAALNPSTCELLPSASFRRPAVAGTVRAISATSDAGVFIGGEFNNVDSQPRSKFAAFTGSGTLTPATVAIDSLTSVRAVLAVPEHGKVFLGGTFPGVNGSDSRALAAVDMLTGANQQLFPGWFPTGSAVKALVTDGAGHLFAGAEGSGYGIFDGRIAADIASGAMLWRDSCLGATQALATHEGVLYGGHHAHECMLTPGGFREDGFRTHLSAQRISDKTLLPTFLPNTNDGVGVSPQGPRALVITSEPQLWVGGEFTTVNGVAQQGLTRFATTDTGITYAPPLSVSQPQAGANTVNWIAAFDRDDDELVYELYRDGQLISTQTRRSREWVRPAMCYVDQGLAPGQQVRYQMRVREPDGQNAGPLGGSLVVTTPVASDPYPAEILKSQPDFYWRLDETGEQAAKTRNGENYLRARVVDSSCNNYTGTAERGYTSTQTGYQLGGESALESGTGKSLLLDGTVGRVAGSFVNDDRPPAVAPSVYSVEFWVKAGSEDGGRLVGFGDNRTSEYVRTQPSDPLDNVAPPVQTAYTSTVNDRHVYMSDNGILSFGKLVGTTKVSVSTTASYNDNLWHHVVATSGPNGMRLFVDGELKASNSNTGSREYSGYWRVGSDSLSGWANAPATSGLPGAIDEFSVFARELTSTEVLRHYAMARPSLGIDLEPPTAVDAVNASVSGGSVEVAWTGGSDNVGIVGYDVYRTGSPNDPPTQNHLIASTAATATTDVGVPAGDWTYWVAAKDARGNVGTATPAAPVTVEVQPITTTLTADAAADTYVNAAAKSTNYGKSSTSIVDSDPEQVTLIRFPLPQAPAGGTLTSAVLRVRTTTSSSASSVNGATVRITSDAWSESSVTYNTRPNVDGPTVGTLAPGVAIDTTYDIPISPAELRALLGSNATLSIHGSGPDSVLLRTRESSGQRPQLLLGFTSGPPDAKAPSKVVGLSANVSGVDVQLAWSPATDNFGVDGYDVYRTSDPAAQPSAADLVASTRQPSYVDPAPPAGTWTYRVAARDAAGNRGEMSDGQTVSISAPVQETVTLAPSADTYVHASFKTTNYGSATSGLTDSEPLQMSYQRYVLPAAPAGKVLTSAVLRIRSTSSSYAGSLDDELVYLADDNWGESTMTFNDRPALASPAIGTLTAPNTLNSFYEIPLTTSSISGLAGQSMTLAIGSAGPDSFQFHSREAAAASRPQLVLTYSSTG